MARIDITDLRERCHALPQKLVLELMGFRQWIELQRFADKWKLPIGGATTDLFAVFRELRSFVAKYGSILSAILEDLPADGSENELGVRYLKAKIAKTEADAEMAQLRVQQKAGHLVDAEMMRQAFDGIIARYHAACDRAQQKWGEDGFEFFDDLANGIRRDLQDFVASHADDGLNANQESAPTAKAG